MRAGDIAWIPLTRARFCARSTIFLCQKQKKERKMTQTLLFCPFATGATDSTFRFDHTTTEVTSICLMAVTFVDAPAAVVMVQIDGVSMNCVTENTPGFPVPIIRTSAPAGGGGQYFAPFLRISNTVRSAIQTMRVRLTNPDGTPYVHTGINFWFVLEGPPKLWDGTQVRASQWVRPPQGVAAGPNDWRWDYVPDQAQVARDMALMQHPLK
jgi:hypothetical protein